MTAGAMVSSRTVSHEQRCDRVVHNLLQLGTLPDSVGQHDGAFIVKVVVVDSVKYQTPGHLVFPMRHRVELQLVPVCRLHQLGEALALGQHVPKQLHVLVDEAHIGHAAESRGATRRAPC